MKHFQLALAFGAIAVIITACNKPLADFTFQPQEATAPAEIHFENHSRNATEFKWDFGDGNTSTDTAPRHVYRHSGNYPITLTAAKGKRQRTTQKRIMITAPTDCLVEIETDLGTMLVKLHNATPQHRDNFLKLAEEGFYDGTLFHRVIKDFMIQGGDPTSRNASPDARLGTGGPGYTIPAEFVDTLFHIKGAVAAARQGDAVNPEKRSSGSQFYIVQGRKFTNEELDNLEARMGIRFSREQREAYTTVGGTPFLDGNYTVFGQVIQGLEVIDSIASVPTNPADRPLKDVKMKVRVIK